MGAYARIYESKKWRKLRRLIIARDRGLCQICLAAGRVTPGNEVDHIVPITDSNVDEWGVVWDPANLRVLCGECHNARHDRNGAGLEKYLKPVEKSGAAETFNPPD